MIKKNKQPHFFVSLKSQLVLYVQTRTRISKYSHKYSHKPYRQSKILNNKSDIIFKKFELLLVLTRFYTMLHKHLKDSLRQWRSYRVRPYRNRIFFYRYFRNLDSSSRSPKKDLNAEAQTPRDWECCRGFYASGIRS